MTKVWQRQNNYRIVRSKRTKDCLSFILLMSLSKSFRPFLFVSLIIFFLALANFYFPFYLFFILLFSLSLSLSDYLSIFLSYYLSLFVTLIFPLFISLSIFSFPSLFASFFIFPFLVLWTLLILEEITRYTVDFDTFLLGTSICLSINEASSCHFIVHIIKIYK